MEHIIAIIIGLAIGAFLVNRIKMYISDNITLRISEDDTFEAYKKNHPDLVKDGRVKCINCGGTSMWLNKVASTPFGEKFAHTCRNCGIRLYHSRS